MAHELSESAIKREAPGIDVPPPPIDPDLFAPNEVETEFIHKALSPDDQVVKRLVLEIQRESYAEYPYPCIRGFHFVSLKMLENSIYGQVLEDGKRSPNALFMDLGCCMGTDVRKLVMDGYDPKRIVGVDLRPSYIHLGHKLYSDSETCPIRFIIADIFDLDPKSSLSSSTLTTETPLPLAQVTTLTQVVNRMRHIHVGALFHLFNEATQFELALRLISLLNLDFDREDLPARAVIFGRQQGALVEGQIDDWLKRDRWAHSPESWERMWHKAFSHMLSSEVLARKRIVVNCALHGHLAGIPAFVENFHHMFWSVQVMPQ